jgi:predicted transcriptional regulator
MATIIELTADIVSAHASTAGLTSDELIQEIGKVHSALKAIEAGQPVEGATDEAKPAITIRQAFRKDGVTCMICGKTGMKTLTRHIKQAHDLKPGQYRKQFNIPASQSLTAKSYSEARRQSALDRGLGDNLAKARSTRAANIAAAKAPAPVKKAVPAAAKAPAKAAEKAVLKTAAKPATKAPAKPAAKATPKVKK